MTAPAASVTRTSPNSKPSVSERSVGLGPAVAGRRTSRRGARWLTGVIAGPGPLVVVLASLALNGCGVAEDASAPMAADVGRPCPPLEKLAPHLSELLRSEQLPALAKLLGETLTQSQLSAVLDAALRVIRALPGGELEALVTLLRSDRVRPALHLLRELLDYAGSSGPGGTLKTALVQHCASGPLFPAVDALLSSPEVLELAEPLRQTLALPEMQSLLGAAGALNREHLAVFLRNVRAALVRPGADPGQSIRTLAETISGLTDLLARPPASTVLEGAITLLRPTGTVFATVRDLMCCDLYGVAQCPDATSTLAPLTSDPVFVYLAYDVFLQHPDELDAVLALLADPVVTDQLEPVVQVLQTLGRDLDVRQTVSRLLQTLLDPAVAASLLPELALLLAEGGFDDLLRLVDAVLVSCPPARDG